MQFPITIGLHRSRIVDGVVVLLAVLASGVFVGYPGDAWLRWGLLLSVWGLALLAGYRLTPELGALRLEQRGEISIARVGATAFLSATIEPGATVHPWLTVLRLRSEDGRRYHLILAVDSANRDDFRRLRTFLRWRASFNAADDA